MKKLILALCLVMGIVLLTACSTPELSEDFNEEEVKAEVEKVIGFVNDNDTDALIEISSKEMKEDLSEEILDDFYEALSKGGKFEKIESMKVGGGKDEESDEEYAVTVAKTKYEDEKFTYTISFTKDMKLIGLYCK